MATVLSVLDYFQLIAHQTWILVDPKDSGRNQSLNNTLFSPLAIHQHAWFKNFSQLSRPTFQAEVLDLVQRKGREVQVYIYNWQSYPKKHGELRSYVQWCLNFQQCDFSVCSQQKVADYLRFQIEALRSGQSRNPNVPVEESSCELYKRVKPILHRLAVWQGYPESCDDKAGPLHLLNTELKQARRDVAKRPRDHHALCRATNKRFKPEEHRAVQQTLWTTAGAANDLQAMRQLLEHCLQNGAGRRGQDLRELQLSMCFMDYIDTVKPSPCHVLSASIYTPKERSDPVPTLLDWVRHKTREECPIAAAAAYLVFLNDIYGFRFLDQIRADLEDLKLLVQQVSTYGTTRTNSSSNRVHLQSSKDLIYCVTTNTFVTVLLQDAVQYYDPKWRRIYLLFGSSPYQPVSYTTHWSDTNSTFSASDLQKGAATHIYRSEVKARQSHAAVGELESDRHMGFRHQTSTDCYGRASHTMVPLLRTAGHLDEPVLSSFKCPWESDGSAIPNEVRSFSCRVQL